MTHFIITTTVTLFFVSLHTYGDDSKHETPKDPGSAFLDIPSQVDLLESTLSQLKNQSLHKYPGTSTHDVTQPKGDVMGNSEKLHLLHQEHERISRLAEKRRDLEEPEVQEAAKRNQEEMTKERRNDPRNKEFVIDSRIDHESSDAEVQTVKRKDDNDKKKDETVLSNPTYQFFLIAILAFCGVGVFLAISVAIIYLIKRIKDDGRRRDTIELDDKGHVGLYYYNASDSNYSDVGSGYTSHSQLSDDVRDGDMTSPYSEEETEEQKPKYNVLQALPGLSLTTKVQPEANNDSSQHYGTFYDLNPSTDNRRNSSSRMAEYYDWNMTLNSDKYGLLNVAQENKRPKSY